MKKENIPASYHHPPPVESDVFTTLGTRVCPAGLRVTDFPLFPLSSSHMYCFGSGRSFVRFHMLLDAVAL